MTKKDFEFIADTINVMDIPASMRIKVAEEFALKLGTTNVRFNPKLFLDRALEG